MKATSNPIDQPRRSAQRLLSIWITALALGGCGIVGAQSVPEADAHKEGRVTIQPFNVAHVRISSTRPFDDVKAALESRLHTIDIPRAMPFMQRGDMAGARAEMQKQASPAGLMILYSLDHGLALAMEGHGPRKAVAYGIGHPLIAMTMNARNLGAGLYAPIRVMLYEGIDRTAVIEYDQPSSSFAVFGDSDINVVASRLDVSLRELLTDISE
jgi:hypothetical protein